MCATLKVYFGHFFFGAIQNRHFGVQRFHKQNENYLFFTMTK